MVLEKVKALVAEQLGIDKNTITPESNVVEDLGADSLDIVEMLMTLEEEYGITIPDEQMGQLKTIGEIVSVIESLKK